MKSCFVAAAADFSVPDEWLSSTCPGNLPGARKHLLTCSHPIQRRTSPVYKKLQGFLNIN